MNNKYYQISKEDVIKILETKITGLDSKEAGKRLEKYGYNEFPKPRKETIIEKFFKELKDPIILLLLLAAIMSFACNEIIDGLAILAIVLIDAIVGIIQEKKAEKSADALQELIQVKAKVLRDDKLEVIDARELTIGDIVLLESGDKVSGDLRIIECRNLLVDESILTGESLPVEKKEMIFEKDVSLANRLNMLYAGTSINTGRAKAVVTEIGKNTEIGSIASSVMETEETKSPLTIRMDKFSHQISIFIIIVAIVIAAILILKGQPISAIFLSVVALAVSSMPEGLPLALTMALTVGSTRMAKKNVIVKKLEAVESLGSCTVIASDKTGTLTVNQQTAKKIVLPNDLSYDIEGSGYNNNGKIVTSSSASLEYAEEICKLGFINNESKIEKEKGIWKYSGDSIDIAFKFLGLKANINTEQIEILDNVPYESELKYSACFFKEDEKIYKTVKGAPDVILNFCQYMKINGKKEPIDKEMILKQNEVLASLGYRVIALAVKEDKFFEIIEIYEEKELSKMIFLGLVAFIDPIRKESFDAVEKCKKAGIKVFMITGDHPLTAFAIGKELGIVESYDEVAKSEELESYYKKGEKIFDEYVSHKKIFTRVTPKQKLHIIESLKRQDEFVAVTGDGVNDAPALKAANVGIAMGSGTDVAKETASMILTDDNFMSIVSGIKEGRVAYGNIRKVIYFLLSCGVAEILFFILSIILNMPMPLVAIQLLWLNVVTDGIQDMALSLETEDDDIMDFPPRNTKESVFDKRMISQIALAGGVSGILVFLCFSYLYFKGVSLTICRGFAMTMMVFIQNIHVLNCKNEYKSVFNTSFFKNKFMLFGIIFSIILQIIVMEVNPLASVFQVESISWIQIITLFLISIIILAVMEFYKWLQKRG